MAQRLSPDGEDGGLYFAQVGKGAEQKACRAREGCYGAMTRGGADQLDKTPTVALAPSRSRIYHGREDEAVRDDEK